jgi:NAD(P)-dependent dehydrogenase (short-subunit alcohol dehydrogenase family)
MGAFFCRPSLDPSGCANQIVSSSTSSISPGSRENSYPLVAYKATKAAMIAFTEQLALQNASYGIRANCILPGLMDTPMAVDTRARASNRSRAEVASERDAKVPLRGRMGTAWDVANAALFLASDEANFITGVALAGRWRRTGTGRLIILASSAADRSQPNTRAPR